MRINPLSRALVLSLVVTFTGCLAPAEEPDTAEAGSDALSRSFPVGTALKTTADVNQRQAASTTSAIQQVIPRGTVVVSGAANPSAGWYGVSWNGKTGWVNGQYLARATDTPTGKDPPSDTVGDYSRREVYNLIRGRLKGGGDPADVLNGRLTTQALVNALGWHATHSPPDWGFSVINSGHHFDPAAHSGGFSIDFFADNAGDDARFMALLNDNPYFVEIGVSGDYAGRRGAITSPGKCAFIENAPTHVHASVKRAFCR